MKLRATIEFDSEVNAYSATCPELNFISSCGLTKNEAIQNLQEAIQLMLQPLPDKFLNKSSKEFESIELAI